MMNVLPMPKLQVVVLLLLLLLLLLSERMPLPALLPVLLPVLVPVRRAFACIS